MSDHSDNPLPEKPQEPFPMKFENFWKKVDKVNGQIHPTKPELGNCWPWLGKLRKNGYGVAWNIATQKEMRAHRASYFMLVGYTNLQLNHSCDFRACTNPSHLWEGTQGGNTMDAAIKLRLPRKLDPKQVLEIRRLRAEGWGVVYLADKFGMSIAAISRIYRGVHWKHLLPGFTPPI